LENRGGLAKRYFEDGYNCCQSIVLAFVDLLDIDQVTALSIAAPFGGGMGRLREVCGAFSGMLIILGKMAECAAPEDREAKIRLYQTVQQMAEDFKNQNGSILCRELLGLEQHEVGGVPEKRTKKYYDVRPCAEICKSAAEILERTLAQI